MAQKMPVPIQSLQVAASAETNIACETAKLHNNIEDAGDDTIAMELAWKEKRKF